MKHLIVVADDFGFTKGVNAGCVDAFLNGILTEMSFMVDSPGSLDAVELCRNNDIKANVGIHLTLNDFLHTGKYLHNADYEVLLKDEKQSVLEQRVKDELKQFEDLFQRVPSHINGHHNVHLHAKLGETISEYVKRNHVYVRKGRGFTDGKSAVAENAFDYGKDILMTDQIFEHIKATYVDAFQGFANDLRTVGDDNVTEIFFHPAVIDNDLKAYTSLVYERERDLRLLKDNEFKANIIKIGFAITDFTRIQNK